MISRIGSNGPRRPAGFTLLELLVVITIIGILLGLVTFSAGRLGRRMKFDGEAKKVHDMIVCARNSAIAQNRRMAVRITKTPKGRWKLVIIDSKDNVFDANDDEVYDPLIMKQVAFDGDQEIELAPEGGFAFWSSNPLVIRDDTEPSEPWMKELTLYPGGGSVEISDIKKLTPAERERQAGSNDVESVDVPANANAARSQ